MVNYSDEAVCAALRALVDETGEETEADDLLPIRKLADAFAPPAGCAPGGLVIEPGQKPRWVILRAPEMILGRDCDCDIVLEHGSVSGRHARLRWDGDDWGMEDLGSANGLIVDGTHTARRYLLHGDLVRLGAVLVLYWAPSSASTTEQEA